MRHTSQVCSSRIDRARLPPYATSCAADLCTSDGVGRARICCMSPRLSRRFRPSGKIASRLSGFGSAIRVLAWQYLRLNVRTGALSHMTSSTEASRNTPQVAVNDIGSEEAFLAAIDETIKYFND